MFWHNSAVQIDDCDLTYFSGLADDHGEISKESCTVKCGQLMFPGWAGQCSGPSPV